MWLQPTDDPHFRHCAKLPQFLVISPPKTGSTWLADNLRCHPQLFIPSIKEVKYFSSLYKCFDLGWYAEHFVPAGERISGEASPSYAILPLEQIKAIRRLLPDLKLIFLMRDPISRAWSHAKHCHRYREANFKEAKTKYENVTEAEWEQNFFHDWTLTSGDYLGQLKLWSSVFPREQMFVGFYEAISTRPIALLRQVFAFLGSDPAVDLSAFPISERILQGQLGELTPHLGAALHRLLFARTVEAVEFIRDRFNLVPPHEWQRTLTPPTGRLVDLPPTPFRSEEGDAHLRQVLEQEEQLHSASCQAPHLLVAGYHGYNLVRWRDACYALPQGEDIDLQVTAEERLKDLVERGEIVVARSLSELQAKVDEGSSKRVGAACRRLPILVESGYHAYNLVLWRGEYYALHQHRLSGLALETTTANILRESLAQNTLLIAPSIREVRAKVDQVVSKHPELENAQQLEAGRM